MVIPPLQTIETQMCQVCDKWGIKYLNISSINESLIKETLSADKPKIVLSSIEKISNPQVQKQLSNLELVYISVNEAQVSLIKV